MPPRRRSAARKTATRTTATRKTTSRASKPPPTPPLIGPGERLFVLAVPFEERGIAAANGARWDPHHRQTIYVGHTLPRRLTPYASADYSWERWIEDEANGSVLPTQPSPTTFHPRPHQQEAIDKIDAAARTGYRGFLEADDVGLGKTISSWAGALRVSTQRGARTALVMCPKSVIPHWRRTIAALGDQGLRVVVINYDQAKKLLTVPESAATATRTRTKNKRIATSGQPVVNWDLILFDESHKIKNQGSQRTRAAARIARYAEAAKSAPFVIWMSATAGQNPIELGYLAPLLSQITGATKSDLKDFGQWLADEGFAVSYNKRFDKWEWGVALDSDTPPPPEGDLRGLAELEAAKERDLRRIRDLLFAGDDTPSIRRLPTDIAGWPEIQRVAFPVDLDWNQKRLYEEAWTTFRTELNLARSGNDPKANGRAARLRFRQKASLIRAPGTVDLILDMLENGHQVAVSVEFHETLDAILDALDAAKVRAVEFTGRNTQDREAMRLAFQRGEASVILFSVTEGISLHALEALPDGSTATPTPRTAIVHDPRYSGLDSLQIEGRCHRDGQSANVYYTFGAGTVEEKITRTLVSRVLSTKSMAGDDVTAVLELEALLNAGPDTAAAPEAGVGHGEFNARSTDPLETDGATKPNAAPLPTSAPRPRLAPNPAQNPSRNPSRKSPQATSQGRSQGRSPSLPTARPQPATPPANPTRSRPSSPAGERARVRPAAPASDGAMTPEERALRAALSGGKPPAQRRTRTAQERKAFDDRLRNG